MLLKKAALVQYGGMNILMIFIHCVVNSKCGTDDNIHVPYLMKCEGPQLRTLCSY